MKHPVTISSSALIIFVKLRADKAGPDFEQIIVDVGVFRADQTIEFAEF